MAKVAALQFASGTDVEQNLASCLRVIDLAGQSSVDLMVLPEFSNIFPGMTMPLMPGGFRLNSRANFFMPLQAAHPDMGATLLSTSLCAEPTKVLP
jgi:predicted amidohydrolase